MHSWVIAGLLGTRAELPGWEGSGGIHHVLIVTSGPQTASPGLLDPGVSHLGPLRRHPGSTQGILLRDGVEACRIFLFSFKLLRVAELCFVPRAYHICVAILSWLSSGPILLSSSSVFLFFAHDVSGDGSFVSHLLNSHVGMNE